MNQTEARRLARKLNAADPATIAVATTVDAHHGRWQRTHEWIVTVDGRPRAE